MNTIATAEKENIAHTLGILNKINRLPILERMYIAERTIHSIRLEKRRVSLSEAADIMLKDYQTDDNLTAFTQLDGESFYEAR